MYLTEKLKIEILMMVGFGERKRSQEEVATLFYESHPDLPPLSRSTVGKIEKQFRELGHVRHVPRRRLPKVSDDTKLDILLSYQENPITPARQLSRDHNIDHKTVLKITKSTGIRPFKMQPVQELLEDDLDRRVEFCEVMMAALDNRQINLDWILFSDEATFTLEGQVSLKVKSKFIYVLKGINSFLDNHWAKSERLNLLLINFHFRLIVKIADITPTKILVGSLNATLNVKGK